MVTSSRILQRKCNCEHKSSGDCTECREKRQLLRKATGGGPAVAPPIVHQVLASPGQPLPASERAFFEPRFGHDFSRVRIHSNDLAAQSAEAVNARAYTVGNNIAFARGELQAGTRTARALLAHELAHVLQNGSHHISSGAITISSDGEAEAEKAVSSVLSGRIAPVQRKRSNDKVLQRVCTPAASCSAPIAGSADEFGISEATVEVSARDRRRRMSPARQRATGHVGRARQLEIFLEAQSPGLLANVHGIFIDQDLSAGTGALTMACDQMVPPITGAVKKCVFVHGETNQEALAFNSTSDATIGRIGRESWRLATLQLLTHEIQHVIFDSASHATPVGISSPSCTSTALASELSELNAILSEFPILFRAIPVGAPATDPSRVRLANWFRDSITNSGESIKGILTQIGCKCECTESDAFVRQVRDFVTASWTVVERNALNNELRNPAWGLRWP